MVDIRNPVSPRWVLGLTLFFQTATNSGLLPETTVSEPALQQAAEPFEWATIWTSQPTDGRGNLGTWYTSERLHDLAERLSAYTQVTGENTRKICAPLKEIRDIADDPENAMTFMDLSPEQKAFIGFVRIASTTPTGRRILEDMSSSDIILCGNKDTPSRLGFYDSDLHAIVTKLRDICLGTNFLPDVAEFFPRENFGLVFPVYAEEMTHAWQDTARDIFLPKNLEASWAADVKLWDLAAEAHAKLISSIMMVEYFRNGGQADVAKAIGDNTPDAVLLNAVMNVYLEHGKNAVEKNPSLLLPVFLSFFEDPVFMQGYFSQKAEIIDPLQGSRRVPFREFREAFGKLPGMKGNMFSGLKEERNLDALMTLVAPDTEMRRWFDAQIAARRKGQKGPPISLPVQTEDDDDTPCNTQPIAQASSPSRN